MAIARTILAFVIAFSVAILPAAGAFALGSKPAMSSTNLVVTEHDCCDDNGMPMIDMTKDCQAAAGCAAKCFSVYGLSSWEGVLGRLPSTPEPLLAASALPQLLGIPPFRPPRV